MGKGFGALAAAWSFVSHALALWPDGKSAFVRLTLANRGVGLSASWVQIAGHGGCGGPLGFALTWAPGRRINDSLEREEGGI